MPAPKKAGARKAPARKTTTTTPKPRAARKPATKKAAVTRQPASVRDFKLFSADGDELGYLLTKSAKRPDYAVQAAVEAGEIQAGVAVVALEASLTDPYVAAPLPQKFTVTKGVPTPPEPPAVTPPAEPAATAKPAGKPSAKAAAKAAAAAPAVGDNPFAE